jgi:hypothetical protein
MTGIHGMTEKAHFRGAGPASTPITGLLAMLFITVTSGTGCPPGVVGGASEAELAAGPGCRTGLPAGIAGGASPGPGPPAGAAAPGSPSSVGGTTAGRRRMMTGDNPPPTP